MRNRTKYLLASMIVLSLFLSACNFGQESEPTPDVGAIFTAAAETVQAQFAIQLTQTALAAPTATQPPTATPTTATTSFPTFAVDGSSQTIVSTPLPTLGVGTQPTTIAGLPTVTPIVALATQAGPLCMDSAFIADITYPDGSVVEDNVKISKRWSIQNTGTCTWDDGFSLQPVTGDAKGTWVIDEKVYKKVEPGEVREVEIDILTPKKGGEWGGCWRMQGDNGQYFGTFLCLKVTVE
jgi:hypothetical protein